MRIKVTIFFCIWTLTSFSQSDEQIIFQILETYNKVSLDFTKNSLESFIANKPSSIYLIDAHFYLADIAERKKDTSSAIRYYSQVIEMNVPDSLDHRYRYISTKRLAEICMSRKQYEETIRYLDLSKKFPTGNRCGNGLTEEMIAETDIYAHCYVALGNLQKAINILIPHMFNTPMEDNSRLVKTLYTTYLKVYSNEKIKNEFMNAENTLEFKRHTADHKVYFEPTIKIFQDKIQVPFSWYLDESLGYWPEKENEYRKKCISFIRASEIYKLATM